MDGYNPNNAEEVLLLPKDSVLDGIIVQVVDGEVNAFVKNMEKWKGDPKQPAINVIIDVAHKGNLVKLQQVFTYNLKAGKTQYSASSNLGKFKTKYGKLPQVQMQVKVCTNNEGFGKIKLD